MLLKSLFMLFPCPKLWLVCFSVIYHQNWLTWFRSLCHCERLDKVHVPVDTHPWLCIRRIWWLPCILLSSLIIYNYPIVEPDFLVTLISAPSPYIMTFSNRLAELDCALVNMSFIPFHRASITMDVSDSIRINNPFAKYCIDWKDILNCRTSLSPYFRVTLCCQFSCHISTATNWASKLC